MTEKTPLFSYFDIGEKLLQMIGRVGINVGGQQAAPTTPSPTSTIKSDGPSTLTAWASDADEKLLVALVRFLPSTIFQFFTALLEQLDKLDKKDVEATDESDKTIGTKGTRGYAFRVRLVGLPNKVITKETVRPIKSQGRKRDQQDQQSDIGQTEFVKTMDRVDDILTENDARVLFIEWLWTLYNTYLKKPKEGAEGKTPEDKAHSSVILDLETLGFLTLKPLTEKARNFLSQAREWVDNEGAETLKKIRRLPIRSVLGATQCDAIVACQTAAGTRPADIDGALDREARKRIHERKKAIKRPLFSFKEWFAVAVLSAFIIFALVHLALKSVN